MGEDDETYSKAHLILICSMREIISSMTSTPRRVNVASEVVVKLSDDITGLGRFEPNHRACKKLGNLSHHFALEP